MSTFGRAGVVVVLTLAAWAGGTVAAQAAVTTTASLGHGCDGWSNGFIDATGLPPNTAVHASYAGIGSNGTSDANGNAHIAMAVSGQQAGGSVPYTVEVNGQTVASGSASIIELCGATATFTITRDCATPSAMTVAADITGAPANQTLGLYIYGNGFYFTQPGHKGNPGYDVDLTTGPDGSFHGSVQVSDYSGGLVLAQPQAFTGSADLRSLPYDYAIVYQGNVAVPACAGTPPPTPQPPPPPTTYAEQQGHHGANTFTNYHNASGMGPRIDPAAWVQVSCKVYDPYIGTANPDGYWYRIASSPWNDQYYAAANTFMNGDPWNGPYTHNTDFAVPDCGSAPPLPPQPAPSPSVTLAQGPAAPHGYWYAITLSSFAPNMTVAVGCYDSVSPNTFRTFSLTTNGSGSASTSSQCYSGDGPDHWVVAGGVESNHVSWGPGARPQPPTNNPGSGGNLPPRHTMINGIDVGTAQNQPHRWGPCTVQDFNGGPYGWVIVSYTGGTHIVRNGMLWGWLDNGGAPGFGCPTDDEHAVGAEIQQNFDKGTLYWKPGMDHARRVSACDPVVLTLVGSGQAADVGIDEMSTVAKAVQAAGTSDGQHVFAVPVSYPAVPWDRFIQAHRVTDTTLRVDLGGLTGSENVGVDNLNAAIRQVQQPCPGRRLMLAGYSQGADVVSRVVLGMTSSQRSKVSVGLLGNPSFLPGYWQDYGSFNGQRRGIRPSFGQPTYELGIQNDIVNRTVDACQVNDPICNFNVANAITLGSGSNAHYHYIDNGYATYVGQQLWQYSKRS